jgi:nitrite reductase/ring-hydroxylating ferredoxin subunit
MLRRDFVLIGVSALAASGCAGARYLAPRLNPGRLSIPSAELAPGAAAFLQTPEMPRPIFVRRDGSGQVVAVLASCTHQGCQPEPVGERLVCPCHGSEFTLEGAVLQGPAERPLQRYEATEENGEVVVWLEPRGAR